MSLLWGEKKRKKHKSLQLQASWSPAFLCHTSCATGSESLRRRREDMPDSYLPFLKTPALSYQGERIDIWGSRVQNGGGSGIALHPYRGAWRRSSEGPAVFL